VSSHSIDQGAARHLRGVRRGELDLHLLEEWLGGLLEEHGSDIYRMKGVLALAHADERYVFHSVHMVMDGTFEPWAAGEARVSRLVFIGRDLDPAALNAGFNSCLDTPQSRETRRKALRFAVGDTVQCKNSDGVWARAEVKELMYRDSGMSPGLVAPYRVKFLNAGLTGAWGHAEYDHDDYVRKPGSRKQTRGGHSHSHSHHRSHAGGHDHGHAHDENCGHLGGDAHGGEVEQAQHDHQEHGAGWSSLLDKLDAEPKG
jgi:hypothetical protein